MSAHITHGAAVRATLPLYRVYTNMRARCERESSDMYHCYGGRGIGVCEQWRENPRAFVDWALTNGYEKSLSIERVDNDGNYSPENCRWATSMEQGSNTSRNRYLIFRGRRQTISQWERETGIPGANIQVRLDRCGWSIERALTEQPKRRKQLIYQAGVGRTANEWAKFAGVSHSTILNRAAKGQDLTAPPTPRDQRSHGVRMAA